MNQALKKTALFVRDLLEYNEQLIRIGRGNEEITDFSLSYIGVDSLGPAFRLGSAESFDDDNEIMNYAQQWQAPVVLSFYGDDAWENAQKFTCTAKSQLAYDLQNTHVLGVFQASNLTDVKTLTGEQYGNRLELNLNIIFSISADVATRYLESVEIQVNSEEAVQVLPNDEIVSVTVDDGAQSQ